jgi:hypothetical protein
MTVAGARNRVNASTQRARQVAQRYCKIAVRKKDETWREGLPEWIFRFRASFLKHPIYNHPCGNNPTDRCATKIRRDEPWR